MQGGFSRARVLARAERPRALGAAAVVALARTRFADAIGAFIAFLFAVPSLSYPFGHDQAVHFYIGREWLRGGLPYRDAFDYKPPAIYALHAMLVALFGEAEWPIRAADLVA